MFRQKHQRFEIMLRKPTVQNKRTRRRIRIQEAEPRYETGLPPVTIPVHLLHVFII